MSGIAPVSAVIAAYNAEKFIAQTIESIQAQTLPVAEIVVVADGSTDATARIARSMGARVYDSNSPGLSAARNKCLRESTQPWIAFLDSDDTWAPEKIERQMQMAVDNPDVALITCDYKTFNESMVLCETILAKYADGYALQPKRSCRNGAVVDRLNAQFADAYYLLLASNVMVRRDAITQTGFFDESLHSADDFDCFMRVLAQHSFAVVEQVLVDKCQHADGTSIRNPQATLSCLAATFKVLEHPELYPSATVQLCKRWLPGNLRHAGARLVSDGEPKRGREFLLQSARLEFSWRTLLALATSMAPQRASRRLMKARYYFGAALGI
jgi:glycosyltransferase involved in cell wall biosynthesis